MDRVGTDRGPGTEQGSRALVALTPAVQGRPFVGGRPMAGFLTQLMIGRDPALRPPRHERSRDAAALYALAARRG